MDTVFLILNKNLKGIPFWSKIVCKWVRVCGTSGQNIPVQDFIKYFAGFQISLSCKVKRFHTILKTNHLESLFIAPRCSDWNI